MDDREIKRYRAISTIRKFHESGAQYRCIVGPVGSGKTSGATLEICYYLPRFIFRRYGIKKTRWVIVRNTYYELRDTTMKTVLDWFPDGDYEAQSKTLHLRYDGGIEVEILFRSCDRPEDVKKFKSLEVTGYWIDESIEVSEASKLMLKNRIGRYPQKSPVKFGVETTNPPDIEHPTYSQFRWTTSIPGPVPEKAPLENHEGFWQPPHENDANLNPGYYNDLMAAYRDNQDWIARYIEGKPGIIVKGKLVYNAFRRNFHVATKPIVWSGGTLYRGWDNTGLCPACVLVQVPTAGRIQVLREFWTDRDGIVDFTRRVVGECNVQFPGAMYVDYGDPAGAAQFSKRGGGLTSNAELMFDECGLVVSPSEQSFTARREAVEQALQRIDGLLIDPGCTRLINGFIGGYNYPEIGNTGVYQEAPEKNRFSHPHDALQYVVVRLVKSQGEVPTSNSAVRSPKHAPSRSGAGWMRK